VRRLFFIAREATRALARAGLAGWLAILSIAALAAFGTALYGARQALNVAEQNLLSQFELEAFLKPGRDDKAQELADWLKARNGVTDVRIVSRQEAAERFSEEYGGELFDLLQENPLPASVIVHYDPSVVTSDWISKEAKEIGNHPEVDDVAYEGELLAHLEELSGKLGIGLLIAAAILAAVAIFLTFQSVRVAVRSGLAWARAVRFIGGTERQVRQPFIAAGMLAGLIGGIFGAGLTAGGQVLLAQGGVVPPPVWPIPAAVTGVVVLLGGIGASAAISRPSRRRRAA